ncbi:hypothetical protein DOE52_09640, partial [Porphyromonas gingivalis]
QMAFYLHLKPNDLEAAPSSRSLCSRRITKEYDLQLLVIFMVCSLRSNWRSIKKRLPAKSFVKSQAYLYAYTLKKKVCLNRTIAIWHTLKISLSL